MKTRKSVFFAALIGLALTAFSFTAIVSSLKVDTNASKVTWVGKKVTGKHEGTVNIKSGSLDVQDGKLTGGAFDIDMTSITVTDLEGEMKGKLEGHLKSADFFGTEDHNTSSFKITKAVHQGKDDYKLVGDLTIKGIKKEIKFPAKVTVDGKKVTAVADITVDRSEFNVKYGSGSFFDNLGDKTIYDDFTLHVELSTK